MNRPIRLVQLMQEFRLHEPPVTAQQLAEATSVSLRTLYRDIETLRDSGARIEGSAGYGYTLLEDPAMPPRIFSHEEIEALVLGLREVQAIADPELAQAASSAMAKIHSTLPNRLKRHLKHSVLHAKKLYPRPALIIDPATLRKAAWNEQAIDIEYRDVSGKLTQRRIYPLSIVYLDNTLVLISHCCLRNATRIFRLDRIQAVKISEESFHPTRVSLLKKAMQSIKKHP